VCHVFRAGNTRSSATAPRSTCTHQQQLRTHHAVATRQAHALIGPSRRCPAQRPGRWCGAGTNAHTVPHRARVHTTACGSMAPAPGMVDLAAVHHHDEAFGESDRLGIFADVTGLNKLVQQRAAGYAEAIRANVDAAVRWRGCGVLWVQPVLCIAMPLRCGHGIVCLLRFGSVRFGPVLFCSKRRGKPWLTASCVCLCLCVVGWFQRDDPMIRLTLDFSLLSSFVEHAVMQDAGKYVCVAVVHHQGFVLFVRHCLTAWVAGARFQNTVMKQGFGRCDPSQFLSNGTGALSCISSLAFTTTACACVRVCPAALPRLTGNTTMRPGASQPLTH